MRLHYALAAALTVSLAAAPSAARSPVALPVAGEPFQAGLLAVDASWQITFDAGGQPRRLAAADLVRWGRPAEPRRGPLLLLADGGLLCAEIPQADEHSVTVDSELFGLVRVPRAAVRAIIYQWPPARLDRDRLLDRLRLTGQQTDWAVLTNGDRLAGRLTGLAQDHLELAAQVGPVNLPISRTTAVHFAGAEAARPDDSRLRLVVGFDDGSRLAPQSLTVDGPWVEIHGRQDQAWSAEADRIVFLQVFGRRVRYLSDLQPADQRQVPYLDLPWGFRPDRSVLGGRLRCDGRLYLKGLGVHTASRLTYALDGKYHAFQASLGIDDCTRHAGSVRYRVFVDSQEQYRSPTIRGGDAALAVSIDVDGAKRLDLVVDYADRADVWDHADWLDARLIR